MHPSVIVETVAGLGNGGAQEGVVECLQRRAALSNEPNDLGHLGIKSRDFIHYEIYELVVVARSYTWFVQDEKVDDVRT